MLPVMISSAAPSGLGIASRPAQAILTEELGITVEGAAAAAWAGLEAIPRPNGAALLIITGSNA